MGVRRSRRRTAFSLAFVLLVASLVTGLFAPVAAQASCAAPALMIGPAGSSPDPGIGQPPSTVPGVAAGAAAAVTGRFFFAECNDTIACTGGCSGCTGGGPSPPMTGLTLLLVQGGDETVLGTGDAADDGTIRWDVTLPSTASPGTATLEVRQATTTVSTLPISIR